VIDDVMMDEQARLKKKQEPPNIAAEPADADDARSTNSSPTSIETGNCSSQGLAPAADRSYAGVPENHEPRSRDVTHANRARSNG
jgi:hypothetical protein